MMKSEGTTMKKALLHHKGRFVEVGRKYDRWKEKDIIKRRLSLKGTGETHL